MSCHVTLPSSALCLASYALRRFYGSNAWLHRHNKLNGSTPVPTCHACYMHCTRGSCGPSLMRKNGMQWLQREVATLETKVSLTSTVLLLPGNTVGLSVLTKAPILVTSASKLSCSAVDGESVFALRNCFADLPSRASSAGRFSDVLPGVPELTAAGSVEEGPATAAAPASASSVAPAVEIPSKAPAENKHQVHRHVK